MSSVFIHLYLDEDVSWIACFWIASENSLLFGVEAEAWLPIGSQPQDGNEGNYLT